MLNCIRKFICLVVFTSLISGLHAQQQLIDKLQKIIERDKSDATRIKALSDLSKIYRYIDTEKGLSYAGEALKLAHQQKDSYYNCYVWCNLHYLYRKMDNDAYPVSVAMDSICYYAEKSDMPESQAYKHFFIFRDSWVRNDKKNYLEAFDALSRLEKQKLYALAINVCYSIEATYNNLNDTESSKKYANKAIELANKSKDSNSLALANFIMGSHYELRYKESGMKNVVIIDSSIVFLKKSLQISTLNEGYITDRWLLGNTALNIAASYKSHYPDIAIDSILEYISIARKWAIKINDEQVLSAADFIMTQTITEKNQSENIERKLNDILINILSKPPVDYYRASNLALVLSQTAEIEKNPQKALDYHKTFVAFYQKLYDAEKLIAVKEIETKYKTEQKEKEIELLKKEEERKEIYIVFSIIFGIVCLLMLFSILRNSKLQKHEAWLKVQLAEEEAARLAAEQKLVQQEKERLQKELLVESMQLNQKKELIANLSEHLKQEDRISLQPISMALKESMMLDKDLGAFKQNIQQLHPDFFNSLQEKTEGKLTALDLKYCAYIYMKMTTKQIAGVMHVEQKTVRMTKYRLKQKLKLDKDENLDQFIVGVI